jgi:hypothetical protein
MSKNIEDLFYKIFNCANEEELKKIIDQDSLLREEKNWVPYGANPNNFGTFENQASHPIPALVEKIINSIDSILLKKCRLLKIDPKDKSAPRTMKEAVALFFAVKDGNLLELSNKGLREIASDIQLIATGDKHRPNLTIFDNGEGQHPDDFPNTFLSLQKGNKSKIHFVQGKYNMGSTGAVVFCGDHRYQLIASKLSNELKARNDNDFGFTLVRRHPLSPAEEEAFTATWYEYFVVEQKVPRFQITEIDLGLWERKFSSGSIVKLYSYELPRGNASSIVWDLWRSLNQYLFQPAIPFLVYEKRGYDQKTPSKMVLGNKSRLSEESENIEKIVTTSISEEEMGDVTIEAILLKRGVSPKEFVNKKAVIFTINGQVHGFYGNAFILELGLPLFRDHLLINVDCTNIKTSFRQDLIKASRDRMNEGPKNEVLNEKIIKALKNSEALREIHQKWKMSFISENKDDEGLLRDVIGKMPFDKELLQLLKRNGDFDFLKLLNSPIDQKKHGETHRDKADKQPLVSKRFPSIFKVDLKTDGDGKRVKTVPLNGRGAVEFETDVQDDYFFRSKDRGELIIEILKIKPNKTGGGDRPGLPSVVDQTFEVTKVGPADHSIKVVFEPKTGLSVGDEVEVEAKLTSPDGDLECVFWIKIVNPKIESNEKTSSKNEDYPNLPTPVKVFETPLSEKDKSWTDYGWTGENVIKVFRSALSSKDQNIIDMIAINMDSNALKKYLSKLKNSNPDQIKLIKDKYFLQMYLHSLFLFGILDGIEKKSEVKDSMETDDKIDEIFKRYASFLLAVDVTNETMLKMMDKD